MRLRIYDSASRRRPARALALLLLLAAPAAVIAAAPSSSFSSSTDALLQAREPTAQHGSTRSSGALNFARSWMGRFGGADVSSATAEGATLQDPERFRRARYGKDMVLRFNISSPHEAASFAEACDTLFLDVWASTSSWVDVRIAEDVVPSLLGLLPKSLQNAHIPIMRNRELLQAIGNSYSRVGGQSNYESFMPPLHRDSGGAPDIFFDEYRPWSVLTHWMELMASMFRTHAKLISIGQSFEGRDIVALRVGTPPSDESAPPKKMILITGGAHAREWISTSTVTYIAYSLLTQAGRSGTVKEMLDRFDWVFVPSVNPDGYVYTWTHDRLWRKNRQPTSLSFCPGVDLDRSFDIHWSGVASDGNPCSENYAGEHAFDGHEAHELARWAEQQARDGVEFAALLDMHSYSQQVLYPYAYSCSQAPANLEDLQELGEGLAKAIRRYGYPYTVIPACRGNVLQQQQGSPKPMGQSAGGSLLDYFHTVRRVRLAYQLKLRDTGSWGFLLPRSLIVPVGDEVWDAVLYLGETLVSKATGVPMRKSQEEAAQEDEQRLSRLRVAQGSKATGLGSKTMQWLLGTG